MQTSRLLANNLTKAFENYKNICKGHSEKWNAMLKCRWVQGTLQPKKKIKIRSWKKTKLNKTENIKTKQQNYWIKKGLKNLSLFFLFNLVLQAPTCTWQKRGGVQHPNK
jgi:hypothetical protein